MKHSTMCLISDLKVNKHFNVVKKYEGVWTLTELRRCNDEVVVEVDIHVGHDDAGVEKSPKNEKPHGK